MSFETCLVYVEHSVFFWNVSG